MSMVKLSETKLVSLLKDILKWKALTSMKHLLLWLDLKPYAYCWLHLLMWLDLKPYAYCWPMQIIIMYFYIKWM